VVLRGNNNVKRKGTLKVKKSYRFNGGLVLLINWARGKLQKGGLMAGEIKSRWSHPSVIS